jgi:hypothetical protein
VLQGGVERRVAHLFSAGLLLCVLLPLGWPPPRDSFPLSSYPMFARERRSALVSAVYAVAFDADGARRWVPPRLVASAEVLQARAVLERAAAGGKPAVDALCLSIARRMVAAGESAVELRIVRASHDAIAFFERGELGDERVLGTCRVGEVR